MCVWGGDEVTRKVTSQEGDLGTGSEVGNLTLLLEGTTQANVMMGVVGDVGVLRATRVPAEVWATDCCRAR